MIERKYFVPEDKEELKGLVGKVVAQASDDDSKITLPVLMGIYPVGKVDFVSQEFRDGRFTENIRVETTNLAYIRYSSRGIIFDIKNGFRCFQGYEGYDERLAALKSNPGMWIEPVKQKVREYM